jgi:hypothetical protein
MAEAKQRRKAPAEPIVPPNAEDYEKPDYLPSGTGLDWLEALRERHVAACNDFARSVDSCGEVEAESDDAARAWRRAVRDAVAVGDPAPERPFNPETQRASREVAEEDTVAARDVLSRVVSDTLDTLRSRRQELEDVPLGEALGRALGAGGDAVERQLNRQLEAARRGGITDVGDPANDAEVEPETETMSNA